jgi:membrane-bound serine protease (ClpP class)
MTLTLAQTATTSSDATWMLAGFALFGLALVLLVLEFVIPSAGALAVLCGASLLAGVVCFFVHSALWGFAALAIALGGAPVAIGWTLSIWSTTPLGRRSVLSAEVRATPAPSAPAPGATGVARTDLRPVGRVEIDGRMLDAIAENGFVEAGCRVEVVPGSEGGTPRVRPIPAP